jgi:hypothetical protein
MRNNPEGAVLIYFAACLKSLNFIWLYEYVYFSCYTFVDDQHVGICPSKSGGMKCHFSACCPYGRSQVVVTGLGMYFSIDGSGAV